MSTATRERGGRSGAGVPGPTRRGRGSTRPVPATADSGDAGTAALRSLSRISRVGPFQLRQLVFVEAAVAAALSGAALGGLWPAPALVIGCALLLLAVVRRHGNALQDWLSTALALRARRRAAVPGTDEADPSLAPVAESVPGFRAYTCTDRNRRTIGMLGDGSFLTAVVGVEANSDALRPVSGARAFPLSLLGAALRVDDIVLESAQLVQQVRPAPAPHLPEQSVARLSYAPLRERTGAPALRLTWVAVKLDPELCREAVEARGGGLEGAQRCLVRMADHVASRITGAGFRAVVLDQEELNSAVVTSSCASPALSARASLPDTVARRRTAETARVWRCDNRWHTTYAVTRWPELGERATPLPELVSLLTSVPAYATTFSLTVRPGPHRGSVNVRGHVRITGGTDTGLVRGRGELEQAARSAKVGLLRLDREQLPGVLATLPLGGAR